MRAGSQIAHRLREFLSVCREAWSRVVGSRLVRLGPAGEAAAARYLRSHGYRILARNFRAAGAEVDLVALDGETLVFVEVKTRIGASRGTPQEAVDHRKQQRIRRAGAIFAARKGARGRPIRFDVIAVTGEGAARRFEIVRDAF